MKLKLASVLATAAMACAGAAQAAPVTLAQSIEMKNPDTFIYNIATFGDTAPLSTFYQLIVDATWTKPTKFTTFLAEPVGSSASYKLWNDTNLTAGASDTGSLVTSWTQADVVSNNKIPFFTAILNPGQYVLQVDTFAGQGSISTNIAAVPLPGALWLFGTALVAFLGISRRRKL